MVSSGCIVLCEAARAAAPARTSVIGKKLDMLPKTPVLDGADVKVALT